MVLAKSFLQSRSPVRVLVLAQVLAQVLALVLAQAQVLELAQASVLVLAQVQALVLAQASALVLVQASVLVLAQAQVRDLVPQSQCSIRPYPAILLQKISFAPAHSPDSPPRHDATLERDLPAALTQC